MASGKLRRLTLREKWHWAARSRLRMELDGLALALRRGQTPEDYARELWGRGAVEWMGQGTPTPSQYLRQEARALSVLYPWMEAAWGRGDRARPHLTLSRDCLAGWGPHRWALAQSLGLAPEQVCRYCQEAFRVWGLQLGLAISINPQPDGTCLLRAEKGRPQPPQDKEV